MDLNFKLQKNHQPLFDRSNIPGDHVNVITSSLNVSRPLTESELNQNFNSYNNLILDYDKSPQELMDFDDTKSVLLDLESIISAEMSFVNSNQSNELWSKTPNYEDGNNTLLHSSMYSSPSPNDHASLSMKDVQFLPVQVKLFSYNTFFMFWSISTSQI